MGADTVEREPSNALDRFISPTRRERLYISWRRFVNSPMTVAGLVIVVTISMLAVFAPVIAPFPEHAGPVTNFGSAREAPSLTHLFGTDQAGRDVFSRVLFGYRFSILLAVFVLGIGVPVGIVLGLTAGYYGGLVERVIMRLTDTFLAVPPLVMALAITSALEPTLFNAMIAIAALWWNWHARLVWSIASNQRNEPYVRAAELSGASTPHILFREILPNCMSPILVKITLDAGFVILIGAGLSFIGVGIQPPRPGLGTMVSQGTTYMPDAWWISLFPGFAILILVMGFNMLGDGLRDLFDVEEVQR